MCWTRVYKRLFESNHAEQNLREHLLDPAEEKVPQQSKTKSGKTTAHKTSLWKNWTFADNLLYTIVSSSYTTSSILTPLLGFKELGLAGSGVSLGGLVGGLPLSLFFGYCVAYAHGEVNNFLDGVKADSHHHHDSAEELEFPADVQPTTIQKVRAWGHAVSDVYGSMAGIILFGETTFAASAFYKRAIPYTLFCAWKCGANKIEFDNIITSCKEQNTQAQQQIRGSMA